jgi:hypothetical protein
VPVEEPSTASEADIRYKINLSAIRSPRRRE